MGCKEVLIQNLVTVTLLLSTVLGLTIGTTLIVIHPEKYTKRVIMYVGYPGEIFMRMMRSVLLPLLSVCIILSLGTMYRQLLKRLGYQYMIYVIATKLEVAILATCIGMVFRPGKTIAPSGGRETKADTESLVTITDIFLDALRNMCPVNLLEAALRLYTTRLVNTNNDTIENLDKWDVFPGDKRTEYQNVLGLLSVCVISGVTLNLMDEEGLYMLSLTKCVVKSTMIIIMWALRLAPIGIMSMMAQDIISMGKAINVLTQMSTFIAALFTAYTIQLVVVYPLMYLVFVRKSPLKFFWNFLEPTMIALSTGRSRVALPYSIFCLRKKIHMDTRIVDFVMPIGTVFNRDGATIYLVLGAVFVTELNNMPMDLVQVCTVVVCSILASVAYGGGARASISMMQALLLSQSFSPKGWQLLRAIEWICARYRAVINLCGNAVAVSVLNQINRDLLEQFPEAVTPPEEKKTIDIQ